MKVGSLVKNMWFDTIHVVIGVDIDLVVMDDNTLGRTTRLITLENGEQWMEEELEVIRESW